jgi:hypothetical protein
MRRETAEVKATLLQGWGYWDTTNYPYGGCFRRVEADTPVTVLGPGGKRPAQERKIQFADGCVGVAELRSLKLAEVR